jgi:hypothetical protein
MSLSEEQRVALMTMVKEGRLTVDEALSEVGLAARSISFCKPQYLYACTKLGNLLAQLSIGCGNEATAELYFELNPNLPNLPSGLSLIFIAYLIPSMFFLFFVFVLLRMVYGVLLCKIIKKHRVNNKETPSHDLHSLISTPPLYTLIVRDQ